ncbi:ferrochelatase [Rickettsiales bacterium]|nr:ferrochelatase [Rickettsiales bacterium]
MSKTAVILFNLGGPDSPAAVESFLFNLFYDKAIIGLPNPFRYILAKLISKFRAPVAKKIYSHMGGKSPILKETQAQAKELSNDLKRRGDYKVFISMRYWKPFSSQVAKDVKKYNPDKIVLLPLYPQYSSTTTGSSFNDWEKSAQKAGISHIPTKKIFSYYDNEHFIDAHVSLIKDNLKGKKPFPRILFSAHGLPVSIIENGDPYQDQVEKTVAAIVEKLDMPKLDWKICYQSRVPGKKWLEPYTDDEIVKAGKEHKAVAVVPVAFVSEHSETLVELDIEYKELAEESGVLNYYRIPTLSIKFDFILALSKLCRDKN